MALIWGKTYSDSLVKISGGAQKAQKTVTRGHPKFKNELHTHLYTSKTAMPYF